MVKYKVVTLQLESSGIQLRVSDCVNENF